MKNFHVEMDAPVLVDSAPRRVRKWGHWQFPKVQRVGENRYEAHFHNANDDYAAYGSPEPCYVSADLTCWEPLPDGYETLVGSVTLPNGDVVKKKALPSARLEDLNIPARPVAGTDMQYRTFEINRRLYTAYPVSDLPIEASGYRLLRRRAGSGEWVEEIAPMEEPDGTRCAFDGILPAMQARETQLSLAPDGSLYMVVYNFQLNPDGSPDPRDRIIFFRSTNGARSFHQISAVPYTPDLALDPNAMSDLRRGIMEPAFAFLDAKRMVCVMRTCHREQGPMYIMRSGDAGYTWTKPAVLHPYGVLPRLCLLKNGVLALSFGRPGVAMMFSGDGGDTWSEPMTIVPQKNGDLHADSCGYTEMDAVSDDTLVLAYSDFNYDPGDGYPRKAVCTRRIRVRMKGERE